MAHLREADAAGGVVVVGVVVGVAARVGGGAVVITAPLGDTLGLVPQRVLLLESSALLGRPLL